MVGNGHVFLHQIISGGAWDHEDSYPSFRLKNKPSTGKAINCGFPQSIHKYSVDIITTSFSSLSVCSFLCLKRAMIHLTTYPLPFIVGGVK